MSVFLIGGDNLDRLTQVVSPGILHYKGAVVINKLVSS